MGILAWIILGGLAGWLASKLAKTDESMGFVANVVVGIIGALIGGFIFNAIGGSGVTGFNLYSLFVSIIGAVVLLWILKALRKG